MSVQPPESIRSTYSHWQWSVASEWPDQATWRLEEPSARLVQFLKVTHTGHFPTANDEGERLRWARPCLPVPEVIDSGSDAEVDWLLTSALDGTDATRHSWLADPARIVPAFAGALAAFHSAAPVDSCPFDFTAATALEHVRGRIRDGVAQPADLHPEHQHLTLERALAELERLASDHEDLVVCHGDYCFPNVLLDADGGVTGYVDVAELGVADRWCDIAVGAWSVTWNVGPGWEDLFYEAYGVQPDRERVAFYRLLYDLAS
ncbi:MAG: kanamycin kinase [Actinomycetota bacterium]|nr:kanamycin kinase [Actinomycetota bacterium]